MTVTTLIYYFAFHFSIILIFNITILKLIKLILINAIINNFENEFKKPIRLI